MTQETHETSTGAPTETGHDDQSADHQPTDHQSADQQPGAQQAVETAAGTELEFTGTERIETTTNELWRHVSDPEVLASCIPGAKSVERCDDRTYDVEISRGIAGLTIDIDGTVELVEREEPNWILAEGTAYDSRTGSEFGGTAAMELSRVDNETDETDTAVELSYQAFLTFSGGTASLSAKILRSVVQADVKRYFANVRSSVESES